MLSDPPLVQHRNFKVGPAAEGVREPCARRTGRDGTGLEHARTRHPLICPRGHREEPDPFGAKPSNALAFPQLTRSTCRRPGPGRPARKMGSQGSRPRFRPHNVRTTFQSRTSMPKGQERSNREKKKPKQPPKPIKPPTPGFPLPK